MRLDSFLKENGYASTRTRAKALIEEGAVTVNGKVITKPAYDVEECAVVSVTDLFRYVGRGGLKLEAALAAFPISCDGCVVLDIGASSGGFTDCALQNGASRVYALDVGQGQLAESLRNDVRVTCLENYNARYLKAEDFEPKPNFVTMDVSFISQTLIFPALASMLEPGAVLVSLIKPQFEAGRHAVRHGGIVRDEGDRQMAIDRVLRSAGEYGLEFKQVIPSPILGGDGNKEYLAYFIMGTES
ncbi:MAG: TlyA family RNA methyltransferase [Clostridia bacterium]|nr:TlyA family RNA methyltransferase [Clostridia bacterium]